MEENKIALLKEALEVNRPLYKDSICFFLIENQQEFSHPL